MLIRTFSSSNQMILKGPALSDTNNTMIQWDNFHPAESNISHFGRDCVYAHASGDWYAFYCMQEMEYICEKIAPARPTLNPISNICKIYLNNKNKKKHCSITISVIGSVSIKANKYYKAICSGTCGRVTVRVSATSGEPLPMIG